MKQKHVSKNTTVKTLVVCAAVFAAVFTAAACKHEAQSGGGSSGGGGVTPPTTTDKTYTVDGVSFTLKSIEAVTSKTVGHTTEVNNQPHPVSISAY